MKTIFLLIVMLVLTVGCSSKRELKGALNEFADGTVREEPNENYLQCRYDDPIALDMVANAALQSEGVIMYFHGGLSGDSYMRETLGPALIKTLFTDENLDGLHPIFMNYDAHPLQFDNFVALLRGSVFDELKDKIQARIDKEKSLENIQLFSADRDETQTAALSILINNGLNTQPEILNSFQSKEDYDQFVAKILTDDETLDNVSRNLIQEPDLLEVSELVSQLDESKQEGALLSFSGAKAVARILARFTFGMNHEFIPTITEEVLREITLGGVVGVGKALQAHWQTVKNHSSECWGPSSNGNKLIIRLLAHKIDNPEFKINLMSHSAGSLVIGKLVEKLGHNQTDKDKYTGAIDNAVLVVPAISAELFKASFMKHEYVVRKLRLYPLLDEYESTDNLLGYVYPASLLYGVSGIAENKGGGDKPLMIQRHMGIKRSPYEKWYYRAIFEDIRPVWDYIEKYPEQVRYYPFEPSTDKGTTHKLTKYPWCSTSLAKQVLSDLTDKPVNEITLGDTGTIRDC